MILSPVPKQSFLDNNGKPLVGGQLFTYAAGTTTKIATYEDEGGSPNTNPVILDYRGEANVWLDPALTYKFTLAPRDDTDPPTNPIWTVDNIAANQLTREIVGRALWPRSQAEIDAGVTPVFYYYPWLNVKRYGALGNFDPSTGVGTDDRQAFVDAMNVAMASVGGAEVIVPDGDYYMGTGNIAFNAVTNPASAQVAIGVAGNPGSATNITVRGQGATIYVGKSGQSWAVYCSQGVRITGLKFFGYTGGTLGSSRENDAPLIISNEAYNVEVDNCYITNSLGDCITIYGDRANLNTTYNCRNVHIHDCVLKERYGDGTPSISGGTMSRFALAVIDCVGLDVHDNWIYGGVDLEPNFNYEHIVDINIHDNQFKSGYVTAQSVIGTAYWYDEPVNLTGGDILVQDVALVSAGSPTCSNVAVRDNNFEYGQITMGGDPNTVDLVEGNIFEQGQIVLGSGAVSRTSIINNRAYAPLAGMNEFIRLTSNVTNSVFTGNAALASGDWDFCLDDDGGADNGANYFSDNICEGGEVFGFNLAASTTVGGTPFVGTWTPTITFATPGDLSVTYSSQVGSYMRIGRMVIATFRMTASAFTHSTAVGELRMNTLPFTSANIANVSYQGSVRWDGITKASYTQVTPKIEPNVTRITFEASGSAQTRSAISVGDMPSGGTPSLIGTITYMTD
jgi:hypothetical protein